MLFSIFFTLISFQAKEMKTFAITDVKDLTGGQLNSKDKYQRHWVAKSFLVELA